MSRSPRAVLRLAAVETPGWLEGKPRFDGTRIGVAMILEYIENGWSDEEILDGWPALTLRDLEAARQVRKR